jgi:hypothetical protein
MPDESGDLRQGGERYPVPDPTALTTEALRREVAALKELLDQRLSALKELLIQRIDGVEAEDAASVKAAQDFCISQFARIGSQLDQVERLRVEQKADTKAAVDAALTAQKEAVREQTASAELAISKSDAATAKQIEQIALTSQASREELRRRADENKERINDLERTLRTAIADVDVKVNAVNAQARGSELSRSALFGWIAAAAAILGIVIILVNVFTTGP